MKPTTLHTILSVVAVGFSLTGLGLILLDMFAQSEVNFLPYALGCIVVGNVLNILRAIQQKKIQ